MPRLLKCVRKDRVKRTDTIRAKWLPNGNIRFFRDDDKKSGVGELCCTACRNPSATVIRGVVGCVIVDYEFY